MLARRGLKPIVKADHAGSVGGMFSRGPGRLAGLALRVPPQPAGQPGRASIKNCINGPQPASFRIRVSWN